jgi:hypothetical protein
MLPYNASPWMSMIENVGNHTLVMVGFQMIVTYDLQTLTLPVPGPPHTYKREDSL